MQPTKNRNRLTGMRAFTLVWLGQILSLLGTSMTNFGLTIWAFEKTGQATSLAMIAFFYVAPLVVLSPVAGAIVDRSNRKLMMMVSDLAAGLMTLLVLALYGTGNLEIWHLFVTSAITGAFQTFQWPAFSAAITLMLPKQQYGRANGLVELAGSTSGIFAPLLAGTLLAFVGLTGILLIDVVTFCFAIGALLVIHVPQPEGSQVGDASRGSLWAESIYGFRYILQRPSLLGLQLVFAASNFFSTLGYTLMAPMILARTMNNEIMLASAQSAGAVGGVVGGVIMSAWGGPKRRIHGVLAGWFVGSLLGQAVFGLGSTLPVWIASSFVWALMSPIINASNQAIWQAKVEPDVQGRVFATRRLIAWAVTPLAQLLAGPLADRAFEPAMQQPSALSDLFGGLVGTGSGAGMGLIVALSGLAAAAIGLGGYTFRQIRDAELILPDFDEEAPLPSAG